MGTKVVLDTNIFVSALGWNGVSRKILNQCIDGILELYLSVEIFEELKRVLNYPQFKFNPEDKKDFLDQILELGILIESAITIQKVEDDPSDNKFLECAVTAEADFIISQDVHLLKIQEINGIQIISPEVFLKKIEKI